MDSHVEEAVCKRILNNKYVDLAKLLTRDRIDRVEDQRMELINRNGMSYWVPVGDRDTTGSITSFAKWEVAFRVFLNIYTAQYPFKSSELLQYCHVIYTASLSYIWENVYNYDREFRLHMSRHHGCVSYTPLPLDCTCSCK